MASTPSASARPIRKKALPPLTAPISPRSAPRLVLDDDDRCELVGNNAVRVSPYKRRHPQRVKGFPRLQTLDQLVERHVDAMHGGDFVARSETRWEQFLQDSAGAVSDNIYPERQKAYTIVRESSALVIQCYWRRYAAVRMLERRVSGVLARQEQVAKWIMLKTATLRQIMHTFSADELSESRPRVQTVIVGLEGAFSHGLYYHLPASVLAWWLRFRRARLAGRFIRRPPGILRTIDWPVAAAIRLAIRVWRTTTVLAVIMLQCAFRGSMARRVKENKRISWLQHCAAVRLQGFFRVCMAHQAMLRKRRRRAAIRIQCCWRCFAARSRVILQRVKRVTSVFCRNCSRDAIARTVERITCLAATAIQRRYRGCRARSYFRQLCSESEQHQWRCNPSKGFALFRKRRYSEAALYFEICMEQGAFQRAPNLMLLTSGTIDSISRAAQASHTYPTELPSGSRMSFSFSSSPMTLGADWIVGMTRTSAWTAGSEGVVSEVVGYLKFWNAYALSHFFTYEATGELLGLRQARTGFDNCFQIGNVVYAKLPLNGPHQSHMRFLTLYCGYRLVQCLFWTGESADGERALALAQKLLVDLSNDGQQDQARSNAWSAELRMISSMILYTQGDIVGSCSQLSELLDMDAQSCFTELELRFTLALLLLRQRDDKLVHTDKTRSHINQAAKQLERCYQIIELWPGVGYYHGMIDSPSAKALLSAAPNGAYLLHHCLDKPQTTDGVTARAPQMKLVLQVKLPDRIASLQIEQDGDGTYRTRKLPKHKGSFSVHEFVASLPAAAGVTIENGIRCAKTQLGVRKRLERLQPYVVREHESARNAMLNWSEWKRWQTEAVSLNAGRSSRRNEAWSAVCLEVAKFLECSRTWVFSNMIARESLARTRNRYVRATASFICARTNSYRHRRRDAARFFEQTHLEVGRPNIYKASTGATILESVAAVECGLSSNVYRSKIEPFSSRLDRVAKLERMCLKAWKFDSLAASLRGDAFKEALLLQRVHDEMFADCEDTFFLRSLLKAHVRSYLTNGSWFEDLHLECAFDCVARLVDKFHGEQLRRRHIDTGVMDQLTQMIEHSTQTFTNLQQMFTVKQFPLALLLLSWHHIPFMICFEIAEVMYRLSAYRSKHGKINLIDVYASLYGRLRGSKPRTLAYSSYEEILLFRLAFLHAANVNGPGASLRHLDSAIECIDTIVELRKERAACTTTPTIHMKKVLWPCTLLIPIRLTDTELAFVRGFLLEIGENIRGTPNHRRDSWKPYRSLHQELVKIVADTQAEHDASIDYRSSTLFRAEHLRGLRVYIGATSGIFPENILRSKPYVSLRCEGTTFLNQTSPMWTDLSPSWDEYIELDVKSAKARIVISVMDRCKRFSRGDDVLIGSVAVYMEELLAAADGATPGQYYALTNGKGSGRDISDARRPQIFLKFQILTNISHDGAAARHRNRLWSKKIGNWKVRELRSNLHGDFQTFVACRWIWSSFGELFRREHEYSIASWFFHKALTQMPAVNAVLGGSTDIDTSILLGMASDMISLRVCYRAMECNSGRSGFACSLLDHAQQILDRLKCITDTSQSARMNKLLAILQDLRDYEGMSTGPLERAIIQRVPASSQWIKVRQLSKQSNLPMQYYFNQDTGGAHVDSCAPLEYESERFASEQTHWQCRGIIVMSVAMRKRVDDYYRELETRRSQDSGHWVAFFNARRQEFQYFSQSTPDASGGGSRHEIKPPSYVLLADRHVIYHVLVVQDAFRRFKWRQRRRRLLRGIAGCACWFAREVFACRRRLFDRSEAIRKATMNCLYVVVEKATGLRAADLLTSDPYVMLTLTDPTSRIVATGRTSVRYNTRNPKWNEEFYFPYAFTAHSKLKTASDGSRYEALGGSSEHSKGDAQLSICVIDHDIIKTPQLDEVDQSSSIKGSTGDFLGQAIVRIAAFEHGKRMTADLELVGNDDGDDSVDSDDDGADGRSKARSRGSLTVSIQWIHQETPSTESELRTESRASVVDPRKTLHIEKPTLPESIAVAISTLAFEVNKTLATAAEVVASTLDPLQKLYKRMRIAQGVGRTAEEAKVLEQRIAALVVTQLAPKYVLVQQGFQLTATRFPSLTSQLRVPVLTYIDEVCDPSTRTDQRVLAQAWISPSHPLPTNTATNIIQEIAAPPSDEHSPLSTSAAASTTTAALQQIVTELRSWILYFEGWSSCITQLLVGFFTSNDIWPVATIDESIKNVCTRLDDILNTLSTENPSSELLSGKSVIGKESVLQGNSVRVRRQEQAVSQVSTDNSVAKRKDRIAREQRKRDKKR